MSPFYLGIDLGGTEVKIAIVDHKGTMYEEECISNNSASIPASVVQQIVARARGMKHFKQIVGTGVGVAGDIDQEKGIVRFSPNLTEWKKIPLKRMLSKALPGPVVIDNDANAAAMGAYWLDAKGAVKNLICVTLGTGVGSGIVCEGKLYRGATGSAGEIGHIPFDHQGPKCNCGSYGCIERYLGASYLSAQARHEVSAKGSKIIKELVDGDLNAITPKILAHAAGMGDVLAQKIWQDAGEKLGIVLAGVINLLNPEIIVFAGGISKAGHLLVDPVMQKVKERAFATSARACKIIVSHYSHRLGVVGAALLAK